MENKQSEIKEVVKYFESIIGTENKKYLGEVTSLDIQRYAISVGEENPLYYKKEAAQKLGFPDIVAPPNMLASIVDWGVGGEESSLHKDGTPAADNLLPEKFTGIKIMGGGENMEFFKPVIAGTEVILNSKIVRSYTKNGRKGMIAFLVFTNTFTDKYGENLAICHRTILAR